MMLPQYDVYDTCGSDQITGSTGTLDELRATYGSAGPIEPGPGAYSPYGCGKNAVTKAWLGLDAVRTALHVKPPVGNRWRGSCNPAEASMCPIVLKGGQPDYVRGLPDSMQPIPIWSFDTATNAVNGCRKGIATSTGTAPAPTTAVGSTIRVAWTSWTCIPSSSPRIAP